MSDFPEEGDDFDVADDNSDFDNGEALEADNLGDDEAELADDDQAEEEGNEPESDAEVMVRLSDGTEVKLSELEGGLYRQADYTKKTTELARQREEVEQTRVQYTERSQSLESTFQKLTGFIEGLIPPEPPLHLAQQNPNAFIQQQAMRQQAIAEFQNLLSVQSEAAGQMQAFSAEDVERARQAEDQQLVKAMPELKDPARRAKFDADNRAFALKFGFSEDQIANTADHRLLRVMHLASIGEKALTNRANAARRVEQPRKGAPAMAAAPVNNSQKAMKRLSQTGSLADALKIDFE